MMEMHRDLTEIIDGRIDARRLDDALVKAWELHGRTCYEAVVETAAERRLRRRFYAELYGLGLRYDGE